MSSSLEDCHDLLVLGSTEKNVQKLRLPKPTENSMFFFLTKTADTPQFANSNLSTRVACSDGLCGMKET